MTNEPSTDSNGHFSFSVPVGIGFCVRAGAPTAPYTWVAANGTTYSDPVITPDYIRPNSAPGKENTSCTVVGLNNSSYEFQVAASPVSPGQCNYKLATNSGYISSLLKKLHRHRQNRLLQPLLHPRQPLPLL